MVPFAIASISSLRRPSDWEDLFMIVKPATPETQPIIKISKGTSRYFWNPPHIDTQITYVICLSLMVQSQ